MGVHVPACNEDGTFKEKQCHSSTGFCWCVNSNDGSEIEGSKKGPADDEVKCGKVFSTVTLDFSERDICLTS